jgi:tyrosyl-tRNA synthetase
MFKASPEWQQNEKEAYPPPKPEEKKKKVKKDKGSRYPGGAKPEVPKPDAEAIQDIEKLKLESKPEGS